MNVRSATPEDKPAIISLLKQSLGESTIPKSEKLWEWKHEENPFGPSYVLLAEDGNTLVGLRAFMRWDWYWDGKICKSIRAVDTATHPDYQGKGIFKKLTLQQIDLCKKQGISFVFNTPNNKSKPGYLKMGWLEQGKLPIKVKLIRPLSVIYARILNRKNESTQKDSPSVNQIWDPGMLTLSNQLSFKPNILTTRLSAEYLAWRYERNPLFSYQYFSDSLTFLVIVRIKTHSFARELRIVEFIVAEKGQNVKKINAEIKKQVLGFCKENKVDFISISGLQYAHYQNYLDWMGFIPVKALGPGITLKDLNTDEKFHDLLNINNWNYSLGDLELF